MKTFLLITFLILWIAALLCGCATYDGPPISFTGSYITEDGTSIGGGVRMEPQANHE